MKKDLALILVVMMLVAAIGCSKNEAETKTEKSAADKWPEQPVNVVVPASAGGGLDNMVLLLNEYFVKKTGKSIVVDNIPNLPGYEKAYQANADGYNFIFGTTTIFTTELEGKLTYDWDDYEMVLFGNSPYNGTCIAVRADSPYPDIIATDLTRFSMHFRPTAFDLVNQVAKYTQLGIPFEQVVACCTSRPAEDMGLSGEIGCLTPGACADVAVFRKEPSSIPFGDRPDGDSDQVLRPASWRLRTMLTVRGGEIPGSDDLKQHAESPLRPSRRAFFLAICRYVSRSAAKRAESDLPETAAFNRLNRTKPADHPFGGLYSFQERSI